MKHFIIEARAGSMAYEEPMLISLDIIFLSIYLDFSYIYYLFLLLPCLW